ncbi:phosphatidylinositol glycan, class U [Hesseltinella vesiculosa]|uniref:Phosphatidylinositol glycan, class U n=1 Tax=Hesseltinella vesiculosa TaxID=101127 RepID=A0A1X2GEC9_9FUNG|nr:phosphatidylinositol glycan, class U [Hesseltinella vesiculosa]
MTISRTHTYLIFLAAYFVRMVLFSIPSFSNTLLQRVEFATPITSYKRLTEGVFLFQSSMPPYSGGVFHQSPLLLVLFVFLSQFPDVVIQNVYSGLDLVLGYILLRMARQKQLKETNDPKLEIEKINTSRINPVLVAVLYLFNPWTVLLCVSRSTSLFTNVGIVMAMYWAMHQRPGLSMLWATVAAYLSLYPIMLVPPLLLALPRSLRTQGIGYFMATFVALLVMSRLVIGSWDFLHATYDVVLYLQELSPNVGMFWYFFIEIFDPFRSFFLMVFQLHCFIFMAPLCIKFKHHPLFVVTILCGIMSIFKSYPCVGDASLFLALVPLHDELFKYGRYGFLVANLFTYASVLSPIFWHLWIYAGSGNANFFYAITLVYNLGQVLLVIDLVYAMLRRQFDLAHPEAIGKQVAQR